MKLDDIFEQDIKELINSVRNRGKKKGKAMRDNLKNARKSNNPTNHNDRGICYDGDGDDAADAITNFQAGGK